MDTIADTPDPESTKIIQGEPRIPSPVAILTEEFASWTTKPFLGAPENIIHDMASSSASSDPVYAAQGKAIVASGKEVSSSRENTVPHVMQDQTRRLELNPTELKNQYQADHSIYRQKLDKEAENIFL